MNTNHYSAYAQERIAIYSERFRSYTINQLVDIFNRETTSKGWVSEKAYYLEALVSTFESCNISTNCIREQDINGKPIITLKHRIWYNSADSSLKILA